MTETGRWGPCFQRFLCTSVQNIWIVFVLYLPTSYQPLRCQIRYVRIMPNGANNAAWSSLFQAVCKNLHHTVSAGRVEIYYCINSSISSCHIVTSGLLTKLSRIHINWLSNNSIYYLFDTNQEIVFFYWIFKGLIYNVIYNMPESNKLSKLVQICGDRRWYWAYVIHNLERFSCNTDFGFSKK